MEWLKLNGWLKEIEIEVEHPICEEFPTVDEGERDKLINNPDDEEECVQPAVEMHVDFYQQQLPAPLPSCIAILH